MRERAVDERTATKRRVLGQSMRLLSEKLGEWEKRMAWAQRYVTGNVRPKVLRCLAEDGDELKKQCDTLHGVCDRAGLS